MTDSDAVTRFMRLYVGNSRSFGRGPKNLTMREAYTFQDMQNHLDGKMSLGVSPILDSASCHFAALDIDNHGSDKDLDHVAMAEAVAKHNLPMVVCRSKSGGAHVYVFMKHAIAARIVRQHLKSWARLLGYPECEIFPKQEELAKDSDGQRQLGSWINLPYYDAGKTNRYAVDEHGNKLTLLQFLELAEKKAVEYTLTESVIDTEHAEAPPCVQRMITEGIPPGHRNLGVYAITVYMKRAFPQDYGQRVRDQIASMKDPLPKSEVEKTIRSASRRDYRYKCGEEPCVSRCDRQTCLKRAHGITMDESDAVGRAALAMLKFSKLVKYVGQPVTWGVHYDGVLLTGIKTQELWSFHKVRDLAAEQLNEVMPVVSAGQWNKMVGALMHEGPQEVEIPDDATIPGMVRVRLYEFIAKANHGAAPDAPDMGALMRGVPIVATMKNKRCVVFRGSDFNTHLKRTRSELMQGKDLWFALQKVGVFMDELQHRGQPVTVWCVPTDKKGNVKLEGPDVAAEY